MNLLDYEEALLQNQLQQESLNNRLGREFSLLDYFISPDPYTQAVVNNDIPQRYTEDSFAGNVVDGLNSTKDYIAGAFSGQNRLDYQRANIEMKQGLLGLPEEQQQQVIAKKSIDSLLDWGFPAGIIGGKLAKNANLKALSKAEKMKKEGASSDEIMQATTDLDNYPNQTGWNLDHPDGKPRFEIDDSGAVAKNIDDWGWGAREDFKHENWTTGPVEEFLQHDKLADSYDGLLGFGDGDRRMMMKVKKNNIDGSYGDNHITLGTVNGKGDDITINRSTAMHELNHAVQEREGFARGGSPEMFNQGRTAELVRDANMFSENVRALKKSNPKADYIALDNESSDMFRELGMDVTKEVRDLASQPYMRFPDKHPKDYKNAMDLVKLYRLDKKTTPDTPFRLYERLAGESEARLASDRMNLSMDERLSNPFYKNYDVPFDDMILRDGDNGLLSMSLEELLSQKTLQSTY